MEVSVSGCRSSEPQHWIFPTASFLYTEYSFPPLPSILVPLVAASESTEWAEAGLSGKDEALKVMGKGGATCAILCRKEGRLQGSLSAEEEEEEEEERRT